jgi:hypothetical protein
MKQLSDRIGLALGAAALLLPGTATACATCVSSAFGDQTYNWPYFGLIVMPFVVTGVVGAVLYRHRGALRSVETYPTPPDSSPVVDTLLDKEMT